MSLGVSDQQSTSRKITPSISDVDRMDNSRYFILSKESRQDVNGWNTAQLFPCRTFLLTRTGEKVEIPRRIRKTDRGYNRRLKKSLEEQGWSRDQSSGKPRANVSMEAGKPVSLCQSSILTQSKSGGRRKREDKGEIRERKGREVEAPVTLELGVRVAVKQHQPPEHKDENDVMLKDKRRKRKVESNLAHPQRKFRKVYSAFEISEDEEEAAEQNENEQRHDGPMEQEGDARCTNDGSVKCSLHGTSCDGVALEKDYWDRSFTGVHAETYTPASRDHQVHFKAPLEEHFSLTWGLAPNNSLKKSHASMAGGTPAQIFTGTRRLDRDVHEAIRTDARPNESELIDPQSEHFRWGSKKPEAARLGRGLKQELKSRKERRKWSRVVIA